MKIIVLAGGYSPEREVSLSSGSLIANALIENGHKVLLADLYLGLSSNYENSYLTKNMDKRFHFEVSNKEPDLLTLKEKTPHTNKYIGPYIIEACQNADLTFLALHGGIGENGQLQALLDIYGITYTGSSYEGCLLSMNKDISKKLMLTAGVKTADWKTYNLNSLELHNELNITYPSVLKPLNCGSSIGVTILENIHDLQDAINAAKAYESDVLIEKKIIGREFSVGILGEKELPPIEIIPRNGFYDYTNKYQTGGTTEICPANITKELERKLIDTAKIVHQILKLGFYSRIDFIVDENETLWCLEANSLPGMTPTSLIPQEAKAAGIEYNELCEMIVQETIK
jgi:D-ala D-ala ligase N-terminal domain protein